MVQNLKNNKAPGFHEVLNEQRTFAGEEFIKNINATIQQRTIFHK